MTFKTILAASAVILLLPTVTQSENPTELGTVTWLRDIDTALTQSEESGKPVLALFQEVPG